MRESVRQAFPDFTDKFEGKVAFMYLDVLGFVTIGRGNLIDPLGGDVLKLPFIHRDGGAPATHDEISAEWNAVKLLQSLAKSGGLAFGAHTHLGLSPAAIDALTFKKLADNDAKIAARFPGYSDWPADAQLGVMSMTWAMGANFRFPNFEAAVAALDFRTAAKESRINPNANPTQPNPGVIRRNQANQILFTNAAITIEQGRDPDVLFFVQEPASASVA